MPVELNSLDNLMNVKGSDKGLPRDDKIKAGLLKAYGDDGAITYLLKHVKKDSTVSVVRDKDGHLAWTIKDNQVNLGSSIWDRFVHKLKMVFSPSYKNGLEEKLDPKINKVIEAYTRCWEAEVDVHEDAKTNIANANEQLRQVQVQLAEQARVAQEAKAQRIVDLTTQISAAEAELVKLNTQHSDLNTHRTDQEAKIREIESSNASFGPKAEYEEKLAALAKVEEAYKGVTAYINDSEEEIIKAGELLLGALRKDPNSSFISIGDSDKRINLKNEFEGVLRNIEKNDSDIATRKGMVAEYNTRSSQSADLITLKNLLLNQLKEDLRKLQGIAVDNVVQPQSVEDPAVTKAKSMGLDADESAFYAGLTPDDKRLYEHLFEPADNAQKCPAFADFFLSILKNKGVTRVSNTLALTDSALIDTRLSGEDAKITLPKSFTLGYTAKTNKDPEVWTLNGDGLRINWKGYDINLDGTRFVIEKDCINIKADSSKQKFPVSLGVATVYKDIRVPYALVKQDAMYTATAKMV